MNAMNEGITIEHGQDMGNKDWSVRITEAASISWDATCHMVVLVKDGAVHMYQASKEWYNSKKGADFMATVKNIWQWLCEVFAGFMTSVGVAFDKVGAWCEQRNSKKA